MIMPKTNLQVVWGGVAGGAGALLWFLLTQVKPKTVKPRCVIMWNFSILQLVFTPLYPWVANWRISEFFLIRWPIFFKT